MSKKRKYGVQCLGCKEKIFSLHRHDFVSCSCGKTFIDGGDEYTRIGWDPKVKYKSVYRLVNRPAAKPGDGKEGA